ncbi:uracil-DNA glycosylase [Thiohalophilus thiocyanatoxydans]|uniref:Type-5 uracil-DNA glycosylase n=1 Tax=Thiohalophilus thiocyanatoxydans TaxID=381308 RepID=A0A4R8IQF8_9GAMM|nr:uracil-DNA glycosylase [Thiohalophilus thiocyanatoxydans]TDY02808.1 uracil-DNA glycosylase family 4 [Thiohalophilus thiocyanatoxydans]
MSSNQAPAEFDPDCSQCPRLKGFLKQVRRDYPDYHARPVAPFGSKRPRLLIVGLAPGMHGANATGRPFTGDFAGILLYKTLYEFGYSNRPDSIALGDGFKLKQCRITNAVKCLPPENKPTTDEMNTCNGYLRQELASLPRNSVILALGGIAHKAVLKAQDLKQSQYKFGHAAHYQLPDGRWLVDSYHCSRYNTQTGRLTEKMFHDVFRLIGKLTD